VFVVGGSALLLDLLDHDSFEDDDLIEIIHENWPEAIRSWRAPGAVPGSLSPVLGPEARKKMRRKFVIHRRSFARSYPWGLWAVAQDGGRRPEVQRMLSSDSDLSDGCCANDRRGSNERRHRTRRDKL
jgi:hypothetical protein